MENIDNIVKLYKKFQPEEVQEFYPIIYDNQKYVKGLIEQGKLPLFKAKFEINPLEPNEYKTIKEATNLAILKYLMKKLHSFPKEWIFSKHHTTPYDKPLTFLLDKEKILFTKISNLLIPLKYNVNAIDFFQKYLDQSSSVNLMNMFDRPCEDYCNLTIIASPYFSKETYFTLNLFKVEATFTDSSFMK